MSTGGTRTVVPLVGHDVVPLAGRACLYHLSTALVLRVIDGSLFHKDQLPCGGDVLAAGDGHEVPFVNGRYKLSFLEALKGPVRG